MTYKPYMQELDTNMECYTRWMDGKTTESEKKFM